MASIFLRPLLRPQSLGMGLGLSIAGYHALHQRPVRLDAPVLQGDSYGRNAQTPVRRNGPLNPRAVRQISSGSITGTRPSLESRGIGTHVS